ncbi:hypothetical protein FB45DRAFT_1082305 [Roridomyces roridus]|uniref:F-box domain-containing protein n=1 Tax=Roridomyces roridus TaxID=1738132 RepID=A0AAD7FJ38_9AGAR|nr:hypothetical protein FB45DRAFT_1082305 [Roridomyces roridus]
MLLRYLHYAPPVISFCVEVGSSPSDASRLRSLLAPYAHRLDSLILSISPETLATFLHAPPLPPFECMQKLSIILESAPEGTDWDMELVGVSGVFAQVPELTDVSISLEHSSRAGWPLDRSFDFVAALPFTATLTNVAVTNVWLWPSETTYLLTRCAQLVCCTLWCDEIGHDIVPPTPVILPNLRELDITFLRMSARLFVDLTAPELESLSLTGCSHANFPCEAIVELTKRSSCDLKVLRLRSELSSQDTDILALLKATANLHTLELRLTPYMDFFGSDDIMHRLVEYIGRHSLDEPEMLPEILPNLRVLQLDLVEGVWEMLRSRAGQLASVILYLDEDELQFVQSAGIFQEEISYLKARGLGVELTAVELQPDAWKSDTSEEAESELENEDFDDSDFLGVFGDMHWWIT